MSRNIIEDLSAYLFGLEEQLARTSVRIDADALDSLLAKDFREFGSSGRIYRKQEMVGALAVEAIRTITLHDFSCVSLSSDVALVTYRSRSDAGEALRSSIWLQRDGAWRMLFHQGTKVSGSLEKDAVF